MRISDWSSDVCSSDLDTLQMGHKVGPLLRGCRRVTVYYNHQDLALKASDYAMGNHDRLGRSGPCVTPECPNKVSVVNVAAKIIWEAKGPNAWHCDPTGQPYFRNNPRLPQELSKVLCAPMDGDLHT